MCPIVNQALILLTILSITGFEKASGIARIVHKTTKIPHTEKSVAIPPPPRSDRRKQVAFVSGLPKTRILSPDCRVKKGFCLQIIKKQQLLPTDRLKKRRFCQQLLATDC